MGKISIRYSRGLETERIVNTLSKMSWYSEHGYKPLLPKNVNSENVVEIVEKEFNQEEYQNAEKELLREFNQEICEEIEKKTGGKPPGEIIVILTKYGTGGSYNLPNKVIINFKANIKHDISHLLKHEIIHLVVEEEVQKRGLTQKQKEAMVNGIMGVVDEKDEI